MKFILILFAALILGCVLGALGDLQKVNLEFKRCQIIKTKLEIEKLKYELMLYREQVEPGDIK